MNDPLDAVFETPEQSLAHFLRTMPKSLVPVFEREFMRRPTQRTLDGAEVCPICERVHSCFSPCGDCLATRPASNASRWKALAK